MLSKNDRARQFLPFDALKGLKEALREKEMEYIERIELSEEMQNEISDKLNTLNINEEIEVTLYKDRKYVELKGKVRKIDAIKKELLVDENIIKFKDIIKI